MNKSEKYFFIFFICKMPHEFEFDDVEFFEDEDYHPRYNNRRRMNHEKVTSTDKKKEIWFDVYNRLKMNNDLGKMFNKLQSNAIKRQDPNLLSDVMSLVELETGKKMRLSPRRR